MLSAHEANKLSIDAGYNAMLNSDEFKRVVGVIEKDINRAASEGRTSVAGPLTMINDSPSNRLLMKAVANYMISFGYKFSYGINLYRALYDCYYECDWKNA